MGSRGTEASELLKKYCKEISPLSSCEFRSFGGELLEKGLCSGTWELGFFRGALVRREVALVRRPLLTPLSLQPRPSRKIPASFQPA